jgi:hypothetical protein
MGLGRVGQVGLAYVCLTPTYNLSHVLYPPITIHIYISLWCISTCAWAAPRYANYSKKIYNIYNQGRFVNSVLKPGGFITWTFSKLDVL